MPDGELIGRIIADNDFTEGVAVSYLSQLLSAVDYLHQLNIAHLDIRVRHYNNPKPSSVMGISCPLIQLRLKWGHLMVKEGVLISG